MNNCSYFLTEYNERSAEKPKSLEMERKAQEKRNRNAKSKKRKVISITTHSYLLNARTPSCSSTQLYFDSNSKKPFYFAIYPHNSKALHYIIFIS